MKIRSPKLLVLVLPLAACAIAEDEGAPVTSEERRPISIDDCENQIAGGIVTEGCRENGKFLLGPDMDRLAPASANHLSVGTAGTKDGDKVSITFTGDASLLGISPSTGRTYLGPDPWFSGVVLNASDGGTITLRNPSGDSLATYFELEYQISKGPVQLPCGLDEDGTRILALPFLGTFSRRGLHQPTIGQISFGCAKAAAYKCFDWGYRAGSDPSVRRGWRAHQACTRMVRFDVCANGNSHTRQETPIGVYDDIPNYAAEYPPVVFPARNEWPPPADLFYFEAAWQGGSEPALCLSKSRWQSLPVGGYGDCAGILPDPRQGPGTPTNPARFCEEYQWRGTDGPGLVPIPSNKDPIIFDTSPYMDLGLTRWNNGGDRIATVRGFHSFDPGGVDPSIEPFGPGYSTYEGLDGILLRARTGTVSEDQVTTVGIYRNPAGDRLIAPVLVRPSYLGANYVLEYDDEGLVFNTGGRNGTVALFIYKSPNGLDLLTTTEAAKPANYTKLDPAPVPAPIGWIIAAGQ